MADGEPRQTRISSSPVPHCWPDTNVSELTQSERCLPCFQLPIRMTQTLDPDHIDITVFKWDRKGGCRISRRGTEGHIVYLALQRRGRRSSHGDGRSSVKAQRRGWCDLRSYSGGHLAGRKESEGSGGNQLNREEQPVKQRSGWTVIGLR